MLERPRIAAFAFSSALLQLNELAGALLVDPYR